MRRGILSTLHLALATYTPGQEKRAFGEILLVYERRGGTIFRGGGGVGSSGDHLVIYESGRAMLTREAMTMEFLLEAETMDRLRTLLEEVDFSTIPPLNPPAQSRTAYSGTDYTANLPEFLVVYRGFRVQAADTAVPVELEPLIAALTDIVAEHAPAPPPGETA
ncbi:MAG: hypothetical protein QMD46_00320 [Methanomicrobiales archaeon]|nr:hypothetical protein [Methanomicrobiales archaeon]MDI6875870.1 hypothetical protein [Methanomicrobiales archaeon]